MQAQGPLARLLMQMESTFKTTPANPKSQQVYISSESLQFSQETAQSAIMRGATRHPTKAVRGNTNVSGGIMSELIAASQLYYAAMGSMSSALTGASTGETLGTSIAPTAGVIDAAAQTFTLTKTSHGLTVGQTVQIAGLTAPTSLNDKYFPIVSVPDANTFVLRIPMSTSTTYTVGSGTFKACTVVATAGLTHTLKAGGNLPSYCIEKGFTDIAKYFKYLGCKCGRLGLSVTSSGLVELSTDWLGASETVGTSSFETGTPLDAGIAPFDNLMLAAADVKEGGSAIAQILSVDNITLENNLDGDSFVVGGSGSRVAITAGTYRVSGTVRAIFEDTVLYNKAIANTESSLDLTWKRGTGVGTAGNESLQLVIPELTFSAKSPTINGPRGVMVELGFEGCYEDGADATALKMIIKNATLPGLMV